MANVRATTHGNDGDGNEFSERGDRFIADAITAEEQDTNRPQPLPSVVEDWLSQEDDREKTFTGATERQSKRVSQILRPNITSPPYIEIIPLEESKSSCSACIS